MCYKSGHAGRHHGKQVMSPPQLPSEWIVSYANTARPGTNDATAKTCHWTHLNEQVVVKAKIYSIREGDAVQLLALQEWQSLNHECHLRQHPHRIQRYEQGVPVRKVWHEILRQQWEYET